MEPHLSRKQEHSTWESTARLHPQIKALPDGAKRRLDAEFVPGGR